MTEAPGAGAVRADKVQAHGQELFVEVSAADVASVRGGDQAVRVDLADELPQFLEICKAREPPVPDIPFVGQVQVPVAVCFQGHDKRFDGPAVSLQSL